jgi:hypothetical protein
MNSSNRFINSTINFFLAGEWGNCKLHASYNKAAFKGALNYCMMKHNDLFKRLLLPGLATMLCITVTIGTSAQLLPDQNPRYRESLQKYLMREDSLTMNEGTTVQHTYKAYQYFEAKRERKDQRRQWRQDRRMIRNTGYWNDYTYNDYARGYSTPYSYGYPTYRSYNSGFRWNDIAAVTAIALGAYILFR